MKSFTISILVLSLFISAFAIDNREDITWLNGNWSGLGYQPNITLPWDIQLKCNTSKKKFVVEYPSLNCQGFWKIEKIESNRIVFREKIAKGKHNCILQGILVITKVDENHISYSYFEEMDGHQILNSFSTLVKG